MNRTKAYNRYTSKIKAIRKKKIADEIYGKNYPYYNNLHQYSKNKIHCSCPLCSAKTRNKGKRRRLVNPWAPAINYKISDLRKKEYMDYEEW